MRIRTCAALAALIVVGCVEDEPTPAEAPSPVNPATQNVAPPPPPEPTGPNPCEVLTEAMVREALPVPEGTEVSQRRGTGYASKICTYAWTDPAFDADAQRRALVEQVQQAAREGRSSEGLARMAAAMRGRAEVVYTHVPPEADAETARQRFEEAMRRLNEGVTHELTRGAAAGQTITLQADTVPVEGLGDAAQWSPSLQQLFVLTGNRFFHLAVKLKPDPAQNLELAKALATRIIG